MDKMINDHKRRLDEAPGKGRQTIDVRADPEISQRPIPAAGQIVEGGAIPSVRSVGVSCGNAPVALGHSSVIIRFNEFEPFSSTSLRVKIAIPCVLSRSFVKSGEQQVDR